MSKSFWNAPVLTCAVQRPRPSAWSVRFELQALSNNLICVSDFSHSFCKGGYTALPRLGDFGVPKLLDSCGLLSLGTANFLTDRLSRVCNGTVSKLSPLSF